MLFRRHETGRRRWVAIAAAYLLVLQAALTGMVSGAHVANAALAQSVGMTLCSSLASHEGAFGEDAGQTDLTDHCRTVCTLAANNLVPISGGHSPIVYRGVDRVTFARQLDTPQGYVGGRSPANPRAPPSKA
ncbi:MAG: hypothetical protein DI537_09320 [Stutzerimonas stutzeri]|nr:MAG: hypothetical protein DI537_09320 [Stutzerimonas stutzeri]